MRCQLGAVALCLVAGCQPASVLAEVPAAAIAAYADLCHEQRPAQVARYQELLASAKESLKQAGKNKAGSKQERAGRIKSARKSLEITEKRLAELSDPLAPYYATQKPNEVAVGKLVNLRCDAQIISVVNETEWLGSLRWYESVLTRRQTASGLNYFSDVPRDYERDVWMSGWSGESPTSEQVLRVTGTYYCTGTKTYDAVSGGTRTVFALEPADLSQHADMFSLWRFARTWTDDTGKHKTEAVLGSYERGRAVLHKKDGSTVRVPLAKLDQESQAAVRDWQREQREREPDDP